MPDQNETSSAIAGLVQQSITSPILPGQVFETNDECVDAINEALLIQLLAAARLQSKDSGVNSYEKALKSARLFQAALSALFNDEVIEVNTEKAVAFLSKVPGSTLGPKPGEKKPRKPRKPNKPKPAPVVEADPDIPIPEQLGTEEEARELDLPDVTPPVTADEMPDAQPFEEPPAPEPPAAEPDGPMINQDGEGFQPEPPENDDLPEVVAEEF